MSLETSSEEWELLTRFW